MKWFFKINWLIQLVVGIGLFTLSFLIENQVLQAFLNAPMIALFLALMLELGKAMAIIWHRYLGIRNPQHYNFLTRILSSMFRGGLVILSLLCSLLFLAQQLDRPYLQEVRSQALQHIDTDLKTQQQRLQTEQADRLQTLRSRQDTEYTQTKQAIDMRTKQLEEWLHNEMNNVVGGVFKGPRYQEFEQQLNQHRNNGEQQLTRLAAMHDQQRLDLHNSLQTMQGNTLLQLEKAAQHKRDSVLTNDYATDERVNNGLIVAFLKVSESVFDLSVEPMQFVFAFSILLSGLMELGIVLAFDTVTVAILPRLSRKQIADLEDDALHKELDEFADKELKHHVSAVSRVKKASDHVMDKLRQYMNGDPDNDPPEGHLV